MKVLPAGGVDCYPLSPLQQGLLYHRLEGGPSGVDVEQVLCEFRESIDRGKFRQAWSQVVARHEILRTIFQLEDVGEPRQTVLSADETPLAVTVLEFADPDQLARALPEFLATDRRRGFPRLSEPLVRLTLLLAGPGCGWLVLTFHHLLMDGRALVVLLRELLDTHDALVAGDVLELPPTTPYRDYIDWLQTLDPLRAESFWRGYLAGLTTPTVVPLARPAVAPETVGADPRGELAARLPACATAGLRAAAQRHGVTLNTLLQGAWAVLLSRYTAETDVVFGAVRACRHVPVPGAASIVGLFINTVPVRVRVEPGAELHGWLQGLREDWVGLRAQEHTPLLQVQQWSDVPPGQGLFETLFNYQEPSWDEALRALGGRWAERHFDIVSQPSYPLVADLYGGAVITIKLLYDRRRFADEDIARMLGHFQVVLAALAGGPAGGRLGELPLLTAAEEEQVRRGGAPAGAPAGAEPLARTDFEREVHRGAERIAIVDTETALTYGELDRRAGELALRLRAHGVHREVVVAVCMERSAEMIVAWLAVWKAGGAFCPLDPDYPPERLAFILADTRAPVVLSQSHLAVRLPDGPAVRLFVDESLPVAMTHRHAANSFAAPAAEDAAYVIYTSGSTGQPKGVVVEHRALANLLAWHRRTFGVTNTDRAAHVASPAFDASVWEIWPYLTAGASVHIPAEETRLAPARLCAWLAAERITIAFLPTPLAEAALEETWPDRAAPRLLLTGGDRLKRGVPAGFPCPLINNYGPTECTVVATSGRVPAHERNGGAPTIGRPIAGVRAYVLDSWMRPVPVGVPGELFLAGRSLARGYLRRPELTAEKFLPDPFAPSAPAAADAPPRMYRTGDRVRWTREGELEFLGRLDGQVKVRGCRIELGEIETTLQRHPAVREAVALIRTDASAQPQLIAYAVPSVRAEAWSLREPRLPEAELMNFLRGKLPPYMVPAAIVLVPAWPLTANGKIDRAALPAPVRPVHAIDDGFAPPATAVEQAIARVWREVLGRGAIDRQENFFDLGGHSLRAAQVVSRLNQTHAWSLTVRDLFDQPTIAGLARQVDARRDAGSATPAPIKRPARRARSEWETLQSR